MVYILDVRLKPERYNTAAPPPPPPVPFPPEPPPPTTKISTDRVLVEVNVPELVNMCN
jgi:hypothetical protein